MIASRLPLSTQSTRFTETMVMVVAVLATGMVYLDQTALTVALPRIQFDLAADIGGVQWLVDIYLLTLATLLLLGGVLGDRYGRVRVYIVGMLIFVVASVACGLAQNLVTLLVGRAVQGVGGALLVPGGLALINATVAPARRGQMIGVWATLTSLVIAFGPSLGGLLVDTLSWRLVFFLNVPLGLVALLVALRYVPENRNETAGGRLDWPGVLSLLLGLGSLLFGLIEGPHLGWQHPLILASLAAGLIGLVVFAGIEAYHPSSMIPLALFRVRTFSGINLLTLIHWTALSSIFFFLTLNLQQVQGYSAFAAGMAMLPISVLIVLLSSPVGRLTDRIGPQGPLLSGVVITGIAFLLFARLGVVSDYWSTFFPVTLIYGLGLSLTIVPVTTLAMAALPARYSGIASGLNNAVSRIGQMMAVAIFGSVMLVGFRSTLAERVANLPLAPPARAELMSQARNLGATTPPAGLTPALAAEVKQAIATAFVASFRQVMLISAAISAFSLLILLVMFRGQSSGPPDL